MKTEQLIRASADYALLQRGNEFVVVGYDRSPGVRNSVPELFVGSRVPAEEFYASRITQAAAARSK